MFAYRRLDRAMDIVRASEYTPADQLARQLGVTARTVRSDIAKINEVLERHGAQIAMKREAGYHLIVDDGAAFDAFQAESQHLHRTSPDLSSAGERMWVLLRTLLGSVDYISYEKLAEKIYVGENTLQNYIRQAKELLADYDLALMVKSGTGVKVMGREANKRRCFMDNIIVRNMQAYVTGFTKDERRLFEGIDLDRLEETVRSHLKRAGVISNDYESKNLIMHTALMINRIQAGCEIESNEHVLISPRIETFIDETCSDLEGLFGIRIGRAERNDYYLHLLINTNLEDAEADEHHFDVDVDAMLEHVHHDYGFDLRDDATLKKSLLDHLASTFQAKSLKMAKRNPLLATIRTNFPLAFEIALSSTLKVFNTEPYTLTEDEVGYVALHIGAAIERKSPAAQELWNVLLVCGSGNSIARMLESRIETYFGDKLRLLGTVSFHEFSELEPGAFDGIAFVVTTVPLPNCPIPHVLVDFSLGTNDTEAVSRLLNTVESEQFNRVGMLFDRDLFVRIDESTTKAEVLSTLCKRLEESKVVGPGFLAAVFERESISDTSMTPAFAIPHSINTMGLKTKVAVAITRDPIKWSSNATEVRIVFLMAIRTADRANIEHLYDLLIDITNSRSMQQAIIATTNFNDFMGALNDRDRH